MKIAVISCWWNEEKLARLFLKAHSYADSIFILSDVFATDNARRIAESDPRVVVSPISMPKGLDDGIKIDSINILAQSLTGKFDWVVAVDSDEFLVSDPRETLDKSGEQGVFRLNMLNLWRHRTDKDFDPCGDLDQRRHGDLVSMTAYRKPCIVRPNKKLRWTVGCHSIHGQKASDLFDIRGTHWGMADPVIAIDRRMARRRRMSRKNKQRGWGRHCFDVTEQKIIDECNAHLDDPLIPELA